MTIDFPKLEQLDQEQIDAAFEFAVQLLAEAHPGLDSRRGVVGQLVVGLDALLSGAKRQQLNNYWQSSSLLQIQQNPELATPELVDRVLANFRVSRRYPTASSGEILIVLDRLLATTIAAGSVFVAEGKKYITEFTYAARTASENVLDEFDRLLVPLGNNTYGFTVPVVAQQTGSAARVTKGSKFVPAFVPLGFVDAYSTGDFTAAVDQETNTELLRRLSEGVAAKAWSNRTNIKALIRETTSTQHPLGNDAFANIVDLSIIGFGDVEMLRDQHGLLPVSSGGRVDMYVRSQPLYKISAVSATATCIENNANGIVWQFGLDRDTSAGAYAVQNIQLPSVRGSFAASQITRLTDLTEITGIPTPDIDTPQEGVYSRYQTLIVRFVDDASNKLAINVNDTMSVSCDVVQMPLVAELQAFVSSRDVTSPAGDVVVKAAIPCFLSVTVSVERKAGATAVASVEAAIQAALAQYVNQIGFVGQLYASNLAVAAAPHLPAGVSIKEIDMFGAILAPDGTTQFVRSNDVLRVPTLENCYVSPRTVSVFLDAADVAVNEILVAASPV